MDPKVSSQEKALITSWGSGEWGTGGAEGCVLAETWQSTYGRGTDSTETTEYGNNNNFPFVNEDGHKSIRRHA